MPDVVELPGAIDLFAGIAVSQREESDLISGRMSVGSPAACDPNLAWVIAECIVTYAHIYCF